MTSTMNTFACSSSPMMPTLFTLQQTYGQQTQRVKPYLATPNYLAYVDVMGQSVKRAPYYSTAPRRQCIPIMYNYVQPNFPTIAPQCVESPRYEYWYTTQ